MQHKLMVLFTTLVMVSLALMPVGAVWAQGQNAQPMTVGGPDHFGYAYDDSISYSWTSASTDSGLIGDDEFTDPIDIGFNFPFYGIPQSQLYLSTNGLITFGAGTWEWSAPGIPNDTNPNSFIAPYWDDLRVGSPSNDGAVYYSQSGSAPNRYFVAEWRDVQDYASTNSFSFEAVLYENGDIVFQYQSLPDSAWPTVGMEDSNGDDGLEYDYGNLSALKAIRFQYPAPAARLLVSPVSRTGGFAPINGDKDFNITISNSGTLGTDTYDLTMTSNWPVTFYDSDNVAPLEDTDSDTVIDTGPLPPGTSTTVIARFRTPGGAKIGDDNTGVMEVTSSLDLSKTKTIYLDMSVPAGFANVFQDNADGSMSFLTGDSNKTSLVKTTPDNYFGYNVAIANLTNGNYLYAWNKYFSSASNVWRDIEYILLDRSGTVILPVTKLTNNSSTTVYTEDSIPSIAVAPDGTIGIVWSRSIENFSTDQFNTNVYFATLNSSGDLLTGPTNITDNTLWGTSTDLNVPRFYSPAIAASDDNHFIIGWEDQQRENMGGYEHDVWYTVQSSEGTSIFPPTALTINGMSWGPILNRLTDDKVIVTWGTDLNGLYYAVIDSSGAISMSETSLGIYTNVNYSPDAIQLPNGKVALAWGTDAGVELAILDSSYQLVHGPTPAFNPSSAMSECLSVTTDSSSRVIITWAAPRNWLLYALGDSAGTFITDPMIYKTSGDYVDVSCNGQGNAPYEIISVISGNVGIPGATLSYTDGTLKTVTADSKGNYSISVPVDWSGTVTPSKTDYAFTPVSKTYSDVQGDQTAQNYAATFITYNITGNAGSAGVTLTYIDGIPQFAIADGSGNYSITVPSRWSGVVTPHKVGYSFTPPNQSYSNVQAHQTAQNYTAAACADVDTVGVFRPSNGLLYLKSSNETGFADMALNYGLGGDDPVVGDWDGNGTVTIGIYRNGSFYLRNENTIGFADIVFPFGNPGDQPVAGDWDGDCVDTIGVYRNGLFLLCNSNSEGCTEMSFNLGSAGDVGIAGDWDGDAIDTTGVFRPSNGIIFLKNTNETGFADIALNYGISGDKPVAGDWDNDGIDTIGVYRNGLFLLRNENTIGFADIAFGLGIPGDMPIAGSWDGKP